MQYTRELPFIAFKSIRTGMRAVPDISKLHQYIFLHVSHMRGVNDTVAGHLLCSDCATVASFPGQREGESHSLHMCLIVVEFHWHRGQSIYVCTLSSFPQAFIVGLPLEIWDHFRSWIFHFANYNTIDLRLDFGESNGLIN